MIAPARERAYLLFAASLELPVAGRAAFLDGHTWGAWNLYGSAACAGGNETAGLAALERVESARRRLYPPQHWAIFSTLIGIGNCLAHQARYAEAEGPLVEGIAGLEAARGAAFRRTQEGYRSLLQVYLALGRTDDASRLQAKLVP